MDNVHCLKTRNGDVCKIIIKYGTRVYISTYSYEMFRKVDYNNRQSALSMIANNNIASRYHSQFFRIRQD